MECGYGTGDEVSGLVIYPMVDGRTFRLYLDRFYVLSYPQDIGHLLRRCLSICGSTSTFLNNLDVCANYLKI